MNIGSQIREKRNELNMTQDELAQKLHVSRSTVANWESERNYPDIQLIVALSKALDIPLDELLSEDADVVKEIAKDTNERRRLGKKLKIVYVILALLVLTAAGLYFGYARDISSPDMISSVSVSGDNLQIKTKLPFYRTLGPYFVNANGNDIDVALSMKLSLEHQEDITISLPDTFPKRPENIRFSDSKGTYKTVKLTE